MAKEYPKWWKDLWQYCHDHYWDPKAGRRFRYVLEIWGDAEMYQTVIVEGEAKTLKQAIKALRSHLYEHREIIKESIG